MSADLPPTIDPQAAARWDVMPRARAPWLHEEVGRRMQERLQWIRLQPAAWADWQPSRGGMQAHDAVAGHYPKAQAWVVEHTPQQQQIVSRSLRQPWWQSLPWSGSSIRYAQPPDGAVDMVWANMALHMAADPKSLLATWQRMLARDGFLMFSGLGPDSLMELRAVYRALGWPAPAHEFTDMHDWGDMLVRAGFAEPVMDMERITLTFDSPARLLEELRGLGRNLHPARFGALRGRNWHTQLLRELAGRIDVDANSSGLALSFEIIYGHALKSAPRLPVQGETTLSLDGMREFLRQGRDDPGPTR